MAYYPGATTGGGAPGSEFYPMSLMDYAPPEAMEGVGLDFQPWLQPDHVPDSLWNYQAPTLDAWSTTPRNWDWALEDISTTDSDDDDDNDDDNDDDTDDQRGRDEQFRADMETAHEEMYPGHRAAADAAGAGGLLNFFSGKHGDWLDQNKQEMAKYGIALTGPRPGTYSADNWQELQRRKAQDWVDPNKVSGFEGSCVGANLGWSSGGYGKDRHCGYHW